MSSRYPPLAAVALGALIATAPARANEVFGAAPLPAGTETENSRPATMGSLATEPGTNPRDVSPATGALGLDGAAEMLERALEMARNETSLERGVLQLRSAVQILGGPWGLPAAFQATMWALEEGARELPDPAEAYGYLYGGLETLAREASRFQEGARQGLAAAAACVRAAAENPQAAGAPARTVRAVATSLGTLVRLQVPDHYLMVGGLKILAEEAVEVSAGSGGGTSAMDGLRLASNYLRALGVTLGTGNDTGFVTPFLNTAAQATQVIQHAGTALAVLRTFALEFLSGFDARNDAGAAVMEALQPREGDTEASQYDRLRRAMDGPWVHL